MVAYAAVALLAALGIFFSLLMGKRPLHLGDARREPHDLLFPALGLSSDILFCWEP